MDFEGLLGCEESKREHVLLQEEVTTTLLAMHAKLLAFSCNLAALLFEYMNPIAAGIPAALSA